MTFFHFINCMALSCTPYFLTYKYAGLSEYGAFWKYIQTGLLYLFIQFCKMMILATFFPSLDDSNFNIIIEFLKTTIDIGDLIGLYIAMTKISGRSEIKYLITGAGWASAELIMTKFLPFWVGARGVEFDWKYIQMSLDSNITLVQHITTALLIYLYNRNDTAKISNVLIFLITLCCYKPLLAEILIHGVGLGSWSLIGCKMSFTLIIGLIALKLHHNIKLNNQHYVKVK